MYGLGMCWSLYRWEKATVLVHASNSAVVVFLSVILVSVKFDVQIEKMEIHPELQKKTITLII